MSLLRDSIVNYPNDKTPYSTGDVIIDLEQTSNVLSKWFTDNYLTLHKKLSFYITDLFSKYDQIPCFLRIRSHLPKKS